MDQKILVCHVNIVKKKEDFESDYSPCEWQRHCLTVLKKSGSTNA